MDDVRGSGKAMLDESDGSTPFYGWLVVGACFCLTLTLGETFWTFGIFFKPLQQEFGWSRALVSSIFTAFLLGYAVSLIASGRLVDRYNPKSVLFISALLIGFGLCLCSVASTINHFRVLRVVSQYRVEYCPVFFQPDWVGTNCWRFPSLGRHSRSSGFSC